MNSKLIFAPLIRVSTERQERKGESLSTQRKQLEQAIKNLNGKIFEWYSGQEHATPDNERKILDKLMSDAEAGKFNAVMVADISRWSRDNKKSKMCLDILKKNKIQFYCLERNWDLNEPFSNFIVGMGTEINEFFAAEQSRKSIINRIEKAKRGFPVAGKSPYGRTYDKEKNEWIVVSKKQEIVREAADRYLSGESMLTIANSYKMNSSNLHKILNHRCGNTWKQRFRNKEGTIDEEVITSIPRLLEENIIKKIHTRSKENKKYSAGSAKYEYLLSKVIFDSKTGKALTGTPNAKGNRYYKPYQGSNAHRYMINADILEAAVLEGLIELLNNRSSFQKAIFEGSPVNEIKDSLTLKLSSIQKEIKAEERTLANFKEGLKLADNVSNFMNIVNKDIEKSDERLKDLRFQYNSIQNQLDALPTKEEIEATYTMTEKLVRQINKNFYRSPNALREIPFQQKRKIILSFFGGHDLAGKKYGINIEPLEGKPKRYHFKAYGRVGYVDGWLNAREKDYDIFTKSKQLDAESLITETANIIRDSDPFCKIKPHIVSKCDAYHCVRLHQR